MRASVRSVCPVAKVAEEPRVDRCHFFGSGRWEATSERFGKQAAVAVTKGFWESSKHPSSIKIASR